MSRGYRKPVGATRISPNGYEYTKTPDGWELTGRIVAAKKLGRKLLPTERIRYKDEDRLNNHPDNIIVYTVRQKSQAARKADLEAKIEELQAQLEELEEAKS